MKNFFAQLPYKIGAFMVGRRGMDNFNVALLVTSVICMVLEILFGWRVLSWVSFVLLIVCCVRCYSKNIAARERKPEVACGIGEAKALVEHARHHVRESQDHEILPVQRVRANPLYSARQRYDAHRVPEMQNRGHEEVVRRARDIRAFAMASCAMRRLHQ